MKAQKSILILVLMVFGLATASLAQTVRTDYDRNVNFSRYRTYSWQKVETTNRLWVDRIKNAVNIALVAKGWRQVARGGDISIAAVGITSEHSTLQTNYRASESWDGGGNDYFQKEYRVGTLVVNVFDNNTKKLVWRGLSSNMLSDKSRKNIKKFDRGVQELFEHFPPKPKD
jgi:hypothetical protein